MTDEPLVRLDAVSHRVTLRGEPLHLARLEFKVLAYLAAREGRAVARAELMREVWQTQWTGDTKTLNMHISWLRRKLGDDAANPRHIITVRGVGFRLEPGVVELVMPAAAPEPAANRVVLVKKGDVLAFGGVGEVSERVAATAAALRDQLGLAEVLLFEGDIEMTAMSGGRRA